MSGYYIITLLVIIYLGNNNNIDFINYEFYKILIFTLLIIFILNLLNKIYLGDGGSYLLSFVIGISIIKLYSQNTQISSLFIILLLWYPCFENLFSFVALLFYFGFLYFYVVFCVVFSVFQSFSVLFSAFLCFYVLLCTFIYAFKCFYVVLQKIWKTLKR